MVRPTLRELSGMGVAPARLSQAALVLIDCQNTYRAGPMQLEGVEEALGEAQTLLARAREAGRPVIHIVHDDGPGSLYDRDAENGQIASAVAPRDGEAVIAKSYPNSFLDTALDDTLKQLGAKTLILAGFMTHMCVSSTARAAFNRGYEATVVAGATATRSLPGPDGPLSAKAVHDGALAGIADLFAVVARHAGDIPD